MQQLLYNLLRDYVTLCFYNVIAFALILNTSFLYLWVQPAAVACGMVEQVAILQQDIVTQNLFKESFTISCLVVDTKVVAKGNENKTGFSGCLTYLEPFSRTMLVRLAGWDRDVPEIFCSSVVSPKQQLTLWKHSYEMLLASFVPLSLDGCGSLIALRQSQRWNHHQSYQFWLNLLKICKY